MNHSDIFQWLRFPCIQIGVYETLSLFTEPHSRVYYLLNTAIVFGRTMRARIITATRAGAIQQVLKYNNGWRTKIFFMTHARAKVNFSVFR